MIIRELRLRNIRSYEDAKLQFSNGRTLFEGDIGSGKSTLLMAIEFAFFGLGSEQGGSMLRVGEKEGEVVLMFETEGVEHTVRRRLERRGDRVQQGPGSLTSEGDTMVYSPSELKEKVLEVLGFNEIPDPKGQSWIYRYAVYTPQEEMKSVLSLPPEQRLQILRRAFRIEDYKVAAENAEEVARETRADARVSDAEAAGVERLREQLEELRRDQGRYLDLVTELSAREGRLEVELLTKRNEVKALHLEKVRLAELKTEKALEERAASEAQERVREVESEMKSAGSRMKVLENAIQRRGEGEAPRRPAKEVEELVGQAEAKVGKLIEFKGRAGGKLSEYESILKDGVCPVCDREVEAHDFGRKKDAKAEELRHVVEELRSAEGSLEALKKEWKSAETWAREGERIDDIRSELARLKEEAGFREEARATAQKRSAEAEGRVLVIAKELVGAKDAEEKLAKIEGDSASTERSLKRVREELVADRRDLELAARRQKEVAEEIAAKEKAVRQRDSALERSIWLGDYFVPTVRLVERSVLGAINREFDSYFRKWFSMLVGDEDKEARVDEDFTPMVTQEGYEQDVWYLSGGERTSVALAYRLALNTLAQKVAASMKSNLLILDEPTDGFSKEQLSNVRDVLDDLGSPQVIMVSHDRELESFADQIVRVTKAGGKSVLESGS